ncbi:MAG: lycopene cyclase family protein [Pseudonocardia sp.]
MTASATDDVLVVGGGPAGRALAAATARCGLRTTLLDPAPDQPWRALYGAWSADLPADLPERVVAARARGRAITTGEHDLGWEYAVLDVPALRAHLDDEMAAAGVRVRAGRALPVDGDDRRRGTRDRARGGDRRSWTGGRAQGGPASRNGDHGTACVALAGAASASARVVVDAGGRWQPLSAHRPGRLPAEQTAVGLVVDEAVATPLVAPGEALFMDWRRDHGEPGWPTFLYAIPLGGGRVLLEETSLARRPGLPLPVLRRRLLARLARHGIVPPADADEDRVHFPVDPPRHPGLGFGAAAPFVHPATGFSVAASLRLAPALARALAAHAGSPTDAVAAARRVLWPPAARVVHALRHVGLEALLRMPPEQVPGFFAVFFDLPERHRWAYLTGRADLPGLAVAMAALYRRADWPLRRRLVGPAVLPALRRNTGS